jgi:pre-mRNA-splicing factor CWC22
VLRCAAQFKRAFKRNDKPIALAVSKFVAHLVNQQVADDIIALEIALLLLENPSGALPSCLIRLACISP